MRHGLKNTPEWRCWTTIKYRCLNTKAKAFPNYGGRGISVYKPWIEKFYLFYVYLNSTIGLRPTENHSIDRIDNDKGYEPGNLRWATASEQNLNRREFTRPNSSAEKNSNHKLTADDVRAMRREYDTTDTTYRALATKYGVNPSTIYDILTYRKWKTIQ